MFYLWREFKHQGQMPYFICIKFEVFSFRSCRSEFRDFNCSLVSGLLMCWAFRLTYGVLKSHSFLMTTYTVLWDSKWLWNTWIWYLMLITTDLSWNSFVVRFVVSFSYNRSSDLEHEGTTSLSLYYRNILKKRENSQITETQQAGRELQTWWNFQCFPFFEVMDNLKSTRFYFCLFLCL